MGEGSEGVGAIVEKSELAEGRMVGTTRFIGRGGEGMCTQTGEQGGAPGGGMGVDE